MKRCRVQVHLDGLSRNIAALRGGVSPNTEIIFVVKSDAYGHGLAKTVTRARIDGIRWFAVAYLHEAIEIRQHVKDAEVLVMGTVEATDVGVVEELNLTPVIMSRRQAEWLSSAAVAAGRVLHVHLKMDTGMGRLGLSGAGALDDLTAGPPPSGIKGFRDL